MIVTCGVFIGILFLEETHAEKKYRRDPGLETGKWILSKFTGWGKAPALSYEKIDDLDETFSLLSQGDEQLPGYRSTEGSPKLPSTPSSEPQDLLDLNDSHFVIREKPAAQKAFTRQVVLNIVGYGILA